MKCAVPCLGGSDGARERGPVGAQCRVRSPFSSLDDTNATGKRNLDAEFRMCSFIVKRNVDVQIVSIFVYERVFDILMFSS